MIHQTEGLFTFGIAFALLLVEAWLLQIGFRRVAERPTRRGGPPVTKLAVALAFLALNFYTYHFLATQAVIPERRHFEAFPLDARTSGRAPSRSRWTRRSSTNLGVTDYLICDFVREDPPAFVDVYVGYHESQVREEGGGAGENSIHPPAHCLPGSGWDIIRGRDRVPSICPACRSDRPP